MRKFMGIEYDYHYEHINGNAQTFEELPSEVQKDLTEWFNVIDPSNKDKQLLLELYQDNRFRAWDCPECGDRVYNGDPDSYDNFQGVLNQDFSYFGNTDKFTEEYINAMCDHCRCYA